MSCWETLAFRWMPLNTHHKNSSGMAQGTQQRAQGDNWAFKDPNQIQHPWDVPWNPTLPTLKNQRIHYWCLSARHHRTPPDVLRPCLYGLEPFRLHKGNLHIIKQVVLMLWQIIVCMYCVCTCLKFLHFKNFFYKISLFRSAHID